MRKLVLAMFTSLDGYIEGPDGKLVFPAWGEDLEIHWSGANLDRAGGIVYGRVCYDGMAGYWQSPAADPKIASRLASLPKFVVSRTPRVASWANTTILHTDVVAQIESLKQQPGKDLVALGGAGLAKSLFEASLIDELRLMVTPVLLGGGKRLFGALAQPMPLRLKESYQASTGAMILDYVLPYATAA